VNVGTELEISIGHRLMDYEGPCMHPHGHNYRIQVGLERNCPVPIPGKGMFIDFKDLKRVLKDVLDPFDHSFMLSGADYVFIKFLQQYNYRVVVVPWNPTAENFAQFIKDQLEMSMAGNYGRLRVRVYETSTSYAEV
jgi:6-pyruvoyltetrahydropterin/6-carboxytetrahydropterin synthase